MNIIMIGEAASHQTELAAKLPSDCAFVALPREAEHSDEYDHKIGSDDVVIALRLSRSNGKIPDFRLLHVPGAGLDGIALDQLSDATTVCNVFEHEIPIAEYVLLVMLESEIRLAHMREQFLTKPWADLYRNREPHGEINGKTVGLIGLGRISRAIAKRAKAFGLSVLATDPYGHKIPGIVDEFIPQDNIKRLFELSDYVVVACPLNDQSRGMVGAQELAAMKTSAMLINISRAEIVDEQSLYQALKNNEIKGAALDVWYRYPTSQKENLEPANLPFKQLSNVYGTPHSCAWTVNLPQRRYNFIAENIKRLLAGQELQNVVRKAI